MKNVKKSEKEKIDSYFFHRRWIGTANIRHFAELLKLKKMSARQLYDFYPTVFIDNENYQSEKKWVAWPYHKRRALFCLKYEIMKAEIEILESNNRIIFNRKLSKQKRAIYENHYAKILKKLTTKKRNFYNKNGDFWVI